jgi:hypothetical protein
VYVLTGHGLRHLGELGAGFVVLPSLADARPVFLAPSDDRSRSAIDRAAKMLRQGGVVAFPTETVYGLGANALDPKAVARVFENQATPRLRSPDRPHIDHLSWVERNHACGVRLFARPS